MMMPWVVSIRMMVKRVMIDTSNFIDINYFYAFQKFRLSTNDLIPVSSSLMIFTSDFNLSLGTIILQVIFKCKCCFRTILAKFIMMDIPSTYNVIINQYTLNRLR